MNEMNVEWTSEDSSQANLEGWDIFECQGSDSGPWQIQRIDDAYIFDSDMDVWKFICKRDTVFGLTELHRKALSFIKQKNKEEYKLIMNEISSKKENKMIEYKVKVFENGTKKWFLNDELHREDGPACEWANGDKFWYLNGKYHREDGPACEWGNGDKYWFLNDELHREDGPAVEYANGNKSWYLNGEEFSKKKWKKRIKKTHKITIDGKEIELSDESFQNIKKALMI